MHRRGWDSHICPAPLLCAEDKVLCTFARNLLWFLVILLSLQASFISGGRVLSVSSSTCSKFPRDSCQYCRQELANKNICGLARCHMVISGTWESLIFLGSDELLTRSLGVKQKTGIVTALLALHLTRAGIDIRPGNTTKCLNRLFGLTTREFDQDSTTLELIILLVPLFRHLLWR